MFKLENSFYERYWKTDTYWSYVKNLKEEMYVKVYGNVCLDVKVDICIQNFQIDFVGELWISKQNCFGYSSISLI